MSKWQIYKRGSMPIHLLDQCISGYFRLCKVFFGADFDEFVYFNDNRILYFVYGVKTINKLNNLILEDILKNTDKKFRSRWIKISDKLLQISDRIINTDINNYSNRQKLKLYKKISNQLEIFHAYTAPSIDILDIFLLEYIKREFNKSAGILQTKENLDLLFCPTEQSFVAQKDEDLLKLSLNPSDKSINKFYLKYYWINFGWQAQPVYSTLQIHNDFKKIKLSRVDIKNRLAKSKNNYKRIVWQKDQLLKKINSSRLTKLVELSNHMMFYHDDRKRSQMVALYAINKILKNINEYKFEDLLWCKEQEIIKHLSSGEPIDMQEIGKRKQGLLVTILNGKLTYKSGLKTKKEFDELVYGNESYANVNEIKGVSSSPGCVTGCAKIILDTTKVVGKLSKKDILITGMTTPDFVPLMKKVGAIVTDEGGLTCHAAIISRELGIPCIIGTKIATQILKDGMMVEVNANHGWIKII